MHTRMKASESELDLERGWEIGGQESSIPLARPGPANKKETGSLGRGGIGCQWTTDIGFLPKVGF